MRVSALDWAFRRGISPLAAATACALGREGDTPLTVLACWWVALKFEETDWCVGIDVVADEWDMDVSVPTVVAREKAVLDRVGMVVPFRTKARSVHEMVPRSHEADAWLYSLLSAGADDKTSEEEWAASILLNCERGRIPRGFGPPPSTPPVALYSRPSASPPRKRAKVAAGRA
jgi:hypothetical protein